MSTGEAVILSVSICTSRGWSGGLKPKWTRRTTDIDEGGIQVAALNTKRAFDWRVPKGACNVDWLSPKDAVLPTDLPHHGGRCLRHPLAGHCW